MVSMYGWMEGWNDEFVGFLLRWRWQTVFSFLWCCAIDEKIL